jgi:hypothetical protein
MELKDRLKAMAKVAADELIDGDQEPWDQLMNILDLTVRVRECQKQYFATRDRSVLAASKLVEKKLDKAINDFSHPQAKIRFG